MYRLLSIILLTLTLCACSLAPPTRPSGPENTLRASSPPPSPRLSPSPSPAPTLSLALSPLPTPFGHDSIREPVYPDLSMWNMRVLAQHEYEGVSVTQFHYFFEWDGEHYEGTNISAMKNVYWNNEWMLEYIGSGDGQYDKFRGFVPDRDRIYLLHGGAVSAREVATGKEIWSLELYGAPFEGVVDSNGKLYVYCAGAPFITAISPDGGILWQHYRVEDYRGAWSMEIIDDEIMILTEDDYGKYHIFFDFDGNYRVEEIEPPEFLNPATVDGPN